MFKKKSHKRGLKVVRFYGNLSIKNIGEETRRATETTEKVKDDYEDDDDTDDGQTARSKKKKKKKREKCFRKKDRFV